MKKPSITLSAHLQALAGGYALAGGAWVVYSLYRIYQASWTTLTLDQWRIYSTYFAKPFPENILTLQNGHPTVFPGLVRLADINLAGAHNHLILIVGILFAITAACLTSWLIWRSRELARPAKMICMTLVWMAIFWMGNSRILVHDPILSYSITLLAFTVALWFLIRADEAYRQRRPDGMNRALMAASLGCFVATFSFGSGLLTWLVTLLIAAMLRFPLKKMGLLGALFLITLVLRFQLPGHDLSATTLSFHPGHVLEAAAIWLGSPAFYIFRVIGMVDRPIRFVICAILGGLMLLAMTAIILKRLIKPHRISSLEIWGLAWSVFGTGMALQVAIGRVARWVGQPHQWVSQRYLPWACLFWLGFLVLMGLYAHRKRRRPSRTIAQKKIATTARAAALRDKRAKRSLLHRLRRHPLASRRGLWLGFVCLVPFLILPGHIVYSWNFEVAKYKKEKAALGLVVGVHDDERVQNSLFKDANLVYRLAGTLQARSLSMFNWDVAGLMDQPFDQTFDIVEGRGILAGDLRQIPFADEEETSARIEGWVNGGDAGAPRYVVVVNAQGRIQGLALLTPLSEDFARRRGRVPDDQIAFSGYIKAYGEGKPYRYFAILADGRSAAPLAAR